MNDPFRILSIDGGGIRGIIPAMILRKIEQESGKRIWELFDLIAGTSTGGILALGLVKPVQNGSPEKPREAAFTAEKLMELYAERGSDIFSRSIWHRIISLGSAIEEKYPSDGIEKVLNEYFGDTRLSEALTNVIVTSYEIEQRRTFFFKSHNAKIKPEEDDYLMRHAARATSAAPTYFEPAKVPTAAPLDYLALIDGGVFANNPSMIAYTEALCKFNPENIVLVSLGTGELTRPLPYDKAKNWGLVNWVRPMLDVVMDGISDAVHYGLDSMCRNNAGRLKRYFRLQATLNEGSDGMDDVGKINIRVLKLIAEELIRTHEKEIADICESLTVQHVH